MTGLLVPAAGALLALSFLVGAQWWYGSEPDLTRLWQAARWLPHGPAAAAWAASAALGALVAAASGMVVLGALATLIAAGIPQFFTGSRLWAERVDTTKAVATWARMLSEQTTAGAGLRRALADTARRTPESIRDGALALSASVERGGFADGARAFAEQLEDEEADVLVGALSIVSSGNAGDIAGALAELARDCDESAEARQRSDTSRVADRTSARLVALIAAVSVGAICWWNRDMVVALRGSGGQAALAVGGGIFVLGHRLMARMDRPPRTYRHVLREPEES